MLLVEDREHDRQLYTALMTRAGADVEAVADVGAIPAEFDRFDAIVLDLVMPGLRGSEAAVLLRTRGFRGALVGLSAHLNPEVAELWRAAGCDDVIPKGEKFVDSLVAAIAEACERRSRD